MNYIHMDIAETRVKVKVFSLYVEVQTGISTQYYVADSVLNTLYPHARP